MFRAENAPEIGIQQGDAGIRRVCRRTGRLPVNRGEIYFFEKLVCLFDTGYAGQPGVFGGPVLVYRRFRSTRTLARGLLAVITCIPNRSQANSRGPLGSTPANCPFKFPV
jgi:hypothetical protein